MSWVGPMNEGRHVWLEYRGQRLSGMSIKGTVEWGLYRVPWAELFSDCVWAGKQHDLISVLQFATQLLCTVWIMEYSERRHKGGRVGSWETPLYYFLWEMMGLYHSVILTRFLFKLHLGSWGVEAWRGVSLELRSFSGVLGKTDDSLDWVVKCG